MASSRCAYCEAVLQPNSAYCMECGQLIPQAPVQRPTAPVTPADQGSRPADPVAAPIDAVPAPRLLPWQQSATPAEPAPVHRTYQEALLSFEDGNGVRVSDKAVLGRRPAETALTLGARPIEVADSTRSVSRVHLLFELVDGKLIVSDMGSANGSRVQRGRAVRALESGGGKVQIESGDIVWIGDVKMTVTAR